MQLNKKEVFLLFLIQTFQPNALHVRNTYMYTRKDAWSFLKDIV
jgi:hypothetical protein